MKLTLIFALILTATAAAPAFAHIEPGTYVGQTADGAACSIEALRQYYVDDVHHPLNERVVLNAGGDEFTVGHPPVIEVATDTAYFNHDNFEGVRATPVGAKALVIDMIHEAGSEGPGAFHLITNNWKTKERSAVHCSGLKLSR